MKVFLIILVIALIAVVFYLWKKKQQVVTKTVIKPRPNPSWTNADWLANGYTQAEIDNYKKGNAIVSDVLSQLNF